ncbi:MAG TPA: GGDEF domain-containing protein, partial [Mycobacteriales bacterium]|nr:GGDEF domain-containing protein [Mycobacteriales bacterium]
TGAVGVGVDAVRLEDGFRRLSGALAGTRRPVVLLGAVLLLAAIALLAVASPVVWCALDVLRPAPVYQDLAVAAANAVMRAGVFLVVVALVTALRQDATREGALGRTDPLTGLANTRSFYELAEAARHAVARTGRPVTVAYLDLDDFKAVNDRLGHAAGDELLRRTAATVAGAVRATDTVARLGGDEFAVLMPGTGRDEAAAVLARVRAALDGVEGPAGPLGSSIGAVTFATPPDGVDAMVAAADAAMYDAKRDGKGRTVWAGA